jgi:hypothetical protein
MKLRSGRLVGTSPASTKSSPAPSAGNTGGIFTTLQSVKTISDICGFCGKVHSATTNPNKDGVYKSPAIFNNDRKQFTVEFIKQSLENTSQTKGRFLKMIEVYLMMEFISDNFEFINSKEFCTSMNFIKTVHNKCIELETEDIYTENPTEKVIADRFKNILPIVKEKARVALLKPYC